MRWVVTVKGLMRKAVKSAHLLRLINFQMLTVVVDLAPHYPSPSSLHCLVCHCNA